MSRSNRLRKPLKERSITFIDTETTGLDPTWHEVIEIAIVVDKPVYPWPSRPPRPISTWSVTVKPQHIKRAEKEALKINGYHPDHPDWAQARHFDEALRDHLLRTMSHNIVIGHNPKFDLDFLNNEIHRLTAHEGEDPCLYNRSNGIRCRTGNVQTLAMVHLVPTGRIEGISAKAVHEALDIQPGTHRALSDVMATRAAWYDLASR